MNKFSGFLKFVILLVVLIIVSLYLYKQFNIKNFYYNEKECLENKEKESRGRLGCNKPSLIKSCAPFCFK